MADALAQKRDDLVPTDWFSVMALVLLGTRFVQGLIFWGGASRRLFYDFHETAGVDLAVKLDFDGPGFVVGDRGHCLPALMRRISLSTAHGTSGSLPRSAYERTAHRVTGVPAPATSPLPFSGSTTR